jgi:hypothetical protein
MMRGSVTAGDHRLLASSPGAWAASQFRALRKRRRTRDALLQLVPGESLDATPLLRSGHGISSRHLLGAQFKRRGLKTSLKLPSRLKPEVGV